MDSGTNLEELKKKVKKFCDERDWDQYHNAKELVIGIVTEASELLEHLRFKSPEQVDEMFRDGNIRQEMSEELADVLYFVLRLAQRYEIDLTEALDKKMEKNEKRYPVERAKGSNKKYTEF